ncbi:hypothetical protein [Methylobacterium sp. B1]|uniref:hypothetical protein n=1 Tax=Methylobacterium sp. B1 TaxID=91459 RepID=UPI000345DE52|nr:hypothetical protein [Methylobacterium sp. B1]
MKKAFDYSKLGISAAQVKSLKASAKGVCDRAHGKKTNWFRDGQAFAEAETFIRDKDFNNWARQEAGVGYSTAKRYARAYTMITERYPGEIDDLDLSCMAVICDLAAPGMLKEVVDELLPQVVVDGAKVTRGDVTAKHIEWAAKLNEPPPIKKPPRASKHEVRIEELNAKVVELQNKLDAQDNRNWQEVEQPTEQSDQTALIEELRAEIAELKSKLGAQDTVVAEPQETANLTDQAHGHDDATGPENAAATVSTDPAEAELARIEAIGPGDDAWIEILDLHHDTMFVLGIKDDDFVYDFAGQVKDAKIAKLRVFHPDRNYSKRELCDTICQFVNGAADEGLKKLHDRSLRQAA